MNKDVLRYLILPLAVLFLMSGCPEPEQPLTDVTEGLAANYLFDGDADDSVGSAHGTASGGVDFTAENRFGTADRACHFDGVDDYIGVGSLDLSSPTAFSLSCWVKYVSGDYLVYCSPFFLYQNFYFCVWPGPTNSAIGSITTDTWTHVVGTYDDSATGIIRLYLNGTLVDTADKGGSAGSLNPAGLEFGQRSGVGGFWNGTVDDLRLYRQLLSNAEVARLYQYQLENE